jgi:hypothetical protein
LMAARCVLGEALPSMVHRHALSQQCWRMTDCHAGVHQWASLRERYDCMESGARGRRCEQPRRLVGRA